MPFCTTCGIEVAQNATFCFSCGAQVGTASDTPPGPDTPPPPEGAWEPPARPESSAEPPARDEAAPAVGSEPSWGLGPAEAPAPQPPKVALEAWPPTEAVGEAPAPEVASEAWAPPSAEGWAPGVQAPATPPTSGSAWGAPPPQAAGAGPKPPQESPAWPPSLTRQAPTVHVSSPPPSSPSSPPTHVPNYLVGSILATLCCCLPTGIVSLIYSIHANTKATQGLFDEAVHAANSAKIWLLVSLVVGFLANLFFFGLLTLAVISDL